MGCICTRIESDPTVNVESVLSPRHTMKAVEEIEEKGEKEEVEEEGKKGMEIIDKMDIIDIKTDTKSEIDRKKQDIQRERELFRSSLLNEINECRANPKAYSIKIESHCRFIKPNPDPKPGSMFLYDRSDGSPKVSLAEGLTKFQECIEYLSNLKPLEPLLLTEALVVKVPKSVDKWTKKETFTELLNEKKTILAEQYKSFRFHFDIGSLDVETSTVLQIVDDNYSFKGERRSNLLSRSYSHVGVSNRKIGKKNCVYMLFAKQS